MKNRLRRGLASLAVIAGQVIVMAAVASPAVLAADEPPAPAAPGAQADRFWVKLDYLAWTVRGDRLPPLVTTSRSGTPRAQAGVLGAQGTTILFGESTVNNEWRSGGRLQVGYWFDPRRTSGIEGSFFALENASTGFSADSGGDPILARPFYDVVSNQQAALLGAFTGTLAGSLSASETSRVLGADVHYVRALGTWRAERLTARVGYRYLRASDRLAVSGTSTITAAGGPIPVGSAVAVGDAFSAASDFHGLDLGVAGELARGRWMLDWQARVALGANRNDAHISGVTTTTVGGDTTTTPGGLLSLSSNSGGYRRTCFAAVPHLALNAGYEFAPGWRVTGRYELLYWSAVQRAGSLIDTRVNPNLLPPALGGGPLVPQAQLTATSLLAHGVGVGVSYSF